MNRRTIALVASLSVGAGIPAWSQQPATEPPPSFRTGVEVVTVDVGVLDDQGRPVGGLGPADFAVTVAGRPRRIVSATFVGVAGTASNAPPSTGLVLPVSNNDDASAIGRLVVFVVDQSTLEHAELHHVTEAASRLFERLTPADRSALVLMPVGSGLPFTADHESVHRALQRAGALASLPTEVRNLGLDEIRAIASGDYQALNNVAARECPDRTASLGGGQGAGGTAGGGSGATSGGGGTGGNAGAGGATSAKSAFDSTDSCTRQLELEVRASWQQLRSTSLASLTALHTVLSRLKSFAGEKAVILISGGWPLESREGTTELMPVAAAAAEARATVFTLFAPSTEGVAERRSITSTPLADMTVRRWALETLAGMTGGDSFRVDAGAADAFDRLARELSGYYRLGVERETVDLDGKSRPMSVQVERRGTKVRAQQRFVVRSYSERDVPSRLDAALAAPMPVSGLGLQLTSYLQANPDRSSQVRVVLVGSVSRLQPGDVILKLALKDAAGTDVASGEQSIGESTTDRLSFSTAFDVAPGRYVARVAVMDRAGAVGSVDHPVDARRTTVGSVTAGDLLLVRMPSRVDEEAQMILDGVRQDERLALQLDLEGDANQVAAAGVVFEVADSDTGAPLIHTEAARLSGGSAATAQAVTGLRLLPPGRYVARAHVTADTGVVGDVRRVFVVTPAPVATAADHRPASAIDSAIAAQPLTRPLVSAPPFVVDQMLTSPVLGVFLDRVAARSDAASASVGPALDRARNAPATEITVPSELLSQAPAVARFLEGVSRLAHAEPAPAADSFRTALRVSPDFYPAMVYLGACWAAVGKDQEAAGAWQTALIKEGDVLELHLLLVDALQRQGKGDAALEAIARARRRWPDEPSLKRRFVTASLVSGRYQDGLGMLDGLPQGPEDEAALALGLQVLYQASVSSSPVEDVQADRARMLRYAEAYRRLNGPSIALVNAWVAAATHDR